VFDDLRRHLGKYYGKYSGEVTKNDPEGTDNMGLIVVKVPSVFGVDAEVTARPCLPYGHFFIPAEGTKVWIEFEGGDTDYPIWVGSWYPQGKTPSPAAISPPDNRVIQTASGHTIELMDKSGSEKIVLHHKGGSELAIDSDGTITITSKKDIALVANDGNGDVTIKANNVKVSVQSTMDVS
jgi:hypothetical protein